MVNHYALRNPQAILHLRADTLSQLLVLANIRPHGRYLVVDDTGGLVTASILDRMGCEGRVLTFTEADSPPAWGVLAAMNFGERELGCVKWLNWMEAGEDYERRECGYVLHGGTVRVYGGGRVAPLRNRGKTATVAPLDKQV
jgi:tRNA (adenine-N(1)-)-methyltransferase non-catalytic subunit